MRRRVLASAVVLVVVSGLASAAGVAAVPSGAAGSESGCAGVFGFAAEPVPVAKAPDGQAVVASVKWGYNAEVDLCYLVLDDSAVSTLRTNPPPQGAEQPTAADLAAAGRCHNAYNPDRGFAAEPVPVVKTADGQAVVASVKWGYNAGAGLCYLVLDDAAQKTLLVAHRCRADAGADMGGTPAGPEECVGEEPTLQEALAVLTLGEMNRLRGGAPLELDEDLTAIVQAHAQAMADASSFGAEFDYWALLEPDWDFWSIGIPVSTPADPDDPRMAPEMSAALLGDEGSRLRPCPRCTHLATGIATADGTTYAMVAMAGPDTHPQLTEQEMAAAEAEMAAPVNQLRADLELEPLAYQPGVAAAARRWSQIMGATSDFNHNPHAGADYPPRYRFAGENIAAVRIYGTLTVSDALRLSFGDFVQSPLHFASMADPETTHIGIGTVLKGGWLWITQNFATHP